MGYIRGIVNVLAYIWQLPQNLLGLFLVLLFDAEPEICFGRKVYLVYDYSDDLCLGMSLGNYILYESGDETEEDIKHEHGHQIQSLILGPLYLLVIGLPSLLWAAFWSSECKKPYNWFYTEKWADKLGGVKK